MKLVPELPWNSVLARIFRTREAKASAPCRSWVHARCFVLPSAVAQIWWAFSIAFAPTVHANVYATNLRIDGGTTNIVASSGTNITISYLLNEPASLGSTVQLRLGTSVVRSLFFPPESQGTLRGFNAITWDGLTSSGQNAPGGTYSVSVTAASSGYTNWTQTTSDMNDQNTYVFDGRGIAVDRNPTSPYYGRIFIANSSLLGPNPSTTPGDTLGILKFNADTSDAEEGISSAGLDGHEWSGGDISPFKIAVSADDYVYVDDLAKGGEIYRWDPTISSNSLRYVLRQDNQPAGSRLSGPAIVGTGTNTQIWMADTNTATLLKWSVTASSVCASNDTGSIVVTNTGPGFFDAALDNNGNIYTCARVNVNSDPSPRVFRYRAYDPSANGGLPETNADWAVGASDDTYTGASGVAVDPTGTYVAVTFEGIVTNGNTKILRASDGALVTNLDLGVAMQGEANHVDTGCAWDAVGNLYYIDWFFARWRAVSPPGTNQATTVALPTIQMTGGGGGGPPSTTLQIIKITVAGGLVTIDFSAGTNASVFTVQGAATVTGPYSTITSAHITQLGPGLFEATVPAGPSTQYFRLVAQGTSPPPPSQLAFTKINVSGANVVLTFSGSPNDSALAFTLLSAPVVNGNYSTNTAATLSQITPGVFQASVPVSGPTQFYRIRR